MGELLILGQPYPFQPANYRGTDRDFPTHMDALANTHPVNQAWRWLIEAGWQSPTARNLQRARELARHYAALAPPRQFEIVESVAAGAQPELGDDLLGYDISLGNHDSLIGSALCLTRPPEWMPAPAPPSQDEIDPLYRLVKTHFRPLLNQHVLFDDAETAQFCLDCMMALQHLRPNMFEGPNAVFTIVGLWTVPHDVEQAP